MTDEKTDEVVDDVEASADEEVDDVETPEVEKVQA